MQPEPSGPSPAGGMAVVTAASAEVRGVAVTSEVADDPIAVSAVEAIGNEPVDWPAPEHPLTGAHKKSSAKTLVDRMSETFRGM